MITVDLGIETEVAAGVVEPIHGSTTPGPDSSSLTLLVRADPRRTRVLARPVERGGDMVQGCAPDENRVAIVGDGDGNEGY